MKNGWTTNSYNDRHHYVDGLIHNDNGPAIIWFEGSQFWFKNNKRHREDGPATEYTAGKKTWYYEDKYIGDSTEGYTQEKFEQWLKFRAFI